MEAAQEEAMRVLLEGLHFSPYALLLEVVENEFPKRCRNRNARRSAGRYSRI